MSFFIGLIQGVGEVLPISSSSHVLFFQKLLGLPSQGQDFFQVWIHGGSLAAFLLYFYPQWASLLLGRPLIPSKSCGALLPRDHENFKWLFQSSLPVVGVGFLVATLCPSNLFQNNSWLIGGVSCAFGLCLIFYSGKSQNPPQTSQNLRKSLGSPWGWGLAQCLGLVQGASRLGSLMLWAMIKRRPMGQSVLVSFLMGIPALGGAFFLKTLSQILAINQHLDGWSSLEKLPLVWGFAGAFLGSYWGLKAIFPKLANRSVIQWIGIYRILFGLGFWALSWVS